MPTSINPEVSSSKLNLVDIFLIAGTKNLSEAILTPFIGNSTLSSGAVKTVAGVAASSFLKGKMGDILGTAWVVDGTEDLLGVLFPALFGSTKSGSRSTNQQVISQRGGGTISSLPTRVL